MPAPAAASDPSSAKYSAGVGTKTLLASESTIVAVNSATTISVTARAAEVRSSVWRMRRAAAAKAKVAMSQVQNRSEPWRPAQTPDTRYSHASGPESCGKLDTT